MQAAARRIDASRATIAFFIPRCLAIFFRQLGGAERGQERETCRSPATKKGRCRLHGGASGSGGPPGQYRHGERTKAAIAE